MEFIIFLFFVTVFLGIIVTISKVQLKQSKKILKKLKDQPLTRVKIKFIQNTLSKFSGTGGLTINAELYFNDEFILITPKVKGLFNGLHNFNLPVIFTKNINEVKNLTGHLNVITPNDFKFSYRKSLIIKYESYSTVKIKYYIKIKPANQRDWYKLSNLKNVC